MRLNEVILAVNIVKTNFSCAAVQQLNPHIQLSEGAKHALRIKRATWPPLIDEFRHRLVHLLALKSD